MISPELEPGASLPKRCSATQALIRPVLLMLLLGLLLSCEQRATPPPPRLVVLYLPCTVNRDFFGPYNETVKYTPHLNRLAERSVVFKRHHTEAPQSGTSFASLLSGSKTSHHGVYINGTSIRDEVEMAFETFAAAGYDVFAWLNHGATGFNYAQGVPKENVSRDLLTAETPRFQQILSDLRTRPDYRALVVTAFSVTHGPYKIDHLDTFCDRYPDECDALADRERFDAYYESYLKRLNYITLSFKFSNASERLGLTGERLEELTRILELAYKSNVYYLDRLFGAVVASVEAAGLIEESLITLAADHGEVLYRDNAVFNWTHGGALAPEVINVPFMILAPGHIKQPGAYWGITRAIDVFPTVASFSGLSAPTGPQFGTDLSAAIKGEEEQPDQLAFSHSTSAGESEDYPNHDDYYTIFPGPEPKYMWAAVRSQDLYFKRISMNGMDWVSQLFDLAVDREQRHNLFDPADPLHRRMEELLIQYKTELNRGYYEHLRTESGAEERKRLEVLKALGYID